MLLVCSASSPFVSLGIFGSLPQWFDRLVMGPSTLLPFSGYDGPSILEMSAMPVENDIAFVLEALAVLYPSSCGQALNL